jgi:hypothetical protein
MADPLTDAQRELLEDKFVLWTRAATEGPVDLRDYNRRAADALKAALALAAEAALATDAQAAWAWLEAHRDLQLEWYCPVYGDDEDDAHEWRVYRESGSINDREFELVGVGETPMLAVASARLTLEAKDRPQ